MSTTIPAPAASYDVRDTFRCDRCGARAVAVSHHATANLAWCGHHLRKHVAGLEAAGVELTRLPDVG